MGKTKQILLRTLFSDRDDEEEDEMNLAFYLTNTKSDQVPDEIDPTDRQQANDKQRDQPEFKERRNSFLLNSDFVGARDPYNLHLSFNFLSHFISPLLLLLLYDYKKEETFINVDPIPNPISLITICHKQLLLLLQLLFYKWNV